MKIAWGALKANAHHILPTERNEGKENWASSLLNVLIIKIFKEYNRRGIKMLMHAPLQATWAGTRLNSVLLISSHIFTIQVFQEADTYNEIRYARDFLEEMPVKGKEK